MLGRMGRAPLTDVIKRDHACERVPLLVCEADGVVAVHRSYCPRPQVRAPHFPLHPDGAMNVPDDYLVADLVVRLLAVCVCLLVTAFDGAGVKLPDFREVMRE